MVRLDPEKGDVVDSGITCIFTPIDPTLSLDLSILQHLNLPAYLKHGTEYHSTTKTTLRNGKKRQCARQVLSSWQHLVYKSIISYSSSHPSS